MNIFNKAKKGFHKVQHDIIKDKSYKKITQSGAGFVEQTFETGGDIEKGVGGAVKGVGKGIGSIGQNTGLFTTLIIGAGLLYGYKLFVENK